MVNAAIEQGEQKGQIHAHFNLNILHTGDVLLKKDGRSINDINKQWWDNALPWQRGCYVQYELRDTRAQNYNLKAGRPLAAEDDSDANGENQVRPGKRDTRGDQRATGVNERASGDDRSTHTRRKDQTGARRSTE